MEPKVDLLPSLSPGIQLSGRACDLMTHYLDKLNFKNDEVQILAAVLYARSLE